MKIIPLVFAVVIVLAGCTSGSSRQAEAATYCSKNGGKVETRYPFYDTNSQSPLRLSGSLQVCTFTANDRSRILIDLNTLYTDRPTLAALAYLKKPFVEGSPSISEYCSELGGTDRFGRENEASGGWGNPDGSDVISLCIFPDFSVIDSWGLSYHAAGVIQGKDLAPLLRYHVDESRKPFD